MKTGIFNVFAVILLSAAGGTVVASSPEPGGGGDPMIAIIGTGDVGRTLGAGWHEAGRDIVFAVRNPASENAVATREATGGEIAMLPVAEAVAAADVVVLATQFHQAPRALHGAGDLTGKILIDATNPLAPDLSGLTVGYTDSAAEQIARWFPDARVVKAFNSTGFNIQADPQFGDDRAAMFLAGDDDEARRIVAGLVEDLGMRPVDAGTLDAARLLEPLAMLWIRLAYREAMGRDFAFVIRER